MTSLLEDQERFKQITQTLFLVRAKNNGRFPYSHSVLILCENSQAVLIDTGCGLDILKKVQKTFNIRTIINSHTHPDHSAGNWLFQNDNCSIRVPEEGFESSGDIIALSERFVEPGWLASYWRNYISKSLGFKDCQPTLSYASSSQLDFGEVVFKPIYTPGHTQDHYCFYEPNLGVLLAFDYDLTAFGPWYGHRESSIPEFKRSIKTLIKLNPRILISGHRGIIEENIIEQLGNFLQQFDERDSKILELLGERNKTIGQLVEKAPIYGSFPYAKPLLRYWEGQMIKKHLKELAKQDKVMQRKNGNYYVV